MTTPDSPTGRGSGDAGGLRGRRGASSPAAPNPRPARRHVTRAVQWLGIALLVAAALALLLTAVAADSAAADHRVAAAAG